MMEPNVGAVESIVYADETACFSLQRELAPVEVVARFTVSGEPASKSRARFTKRGGKMHAYTPQATKDAEQMIAWKFRESARGWQTATKGAFGVAAKFFQGTRQRRDVDNMIKLICDALNGVAWSDDNQVVEVSGRKVYVEHSEYARTEVLIYRSEEQKAPHKSCARCGKEFPVYESTMGRKYCSGACAYAHRRENRARTCQNCGEEFDHRKPGADTARYCSRECRSEDTTNELTCEGCGVEFRRPKSQTKSRAYCSKDCFYASKTHCPQGHEYTPENTYTDPTRGRRNCRTCRTEASRRRRERIRAQKSGEAA